ncbi:hypothetical protein W97_01203 [Coniosporium apollinis CBS 100218]|uniref:Uncharacterized protein n=1 Tax=Coniosporium apollinis (strain CBS 100218) TaxID=1168221 RepID=R7YJA5_CONA1|nr:uncharacterized protein W97_01203 [Coniosporium apollinis CBS 100218]EON61985.1 hypothetical protein W97_01203 [Coniosporium apollinis CBS 100218]
MRLTAIVPCLCALAAMVPCFLCMFAGNKPGFMEDYHMVTLNTSRIGHNFLVNSTLVPAGDNILTDVFRNASSSITSSINSALDSLAAELGLSDFYSVHLLNYCSGTYTTSALASTTAPRSTITKNVTSCSRPRALFHFDPTAALTRSLNTTTSGSTNITLSTLHWPTELSTGITALRIAHHTAFTLYILAIVLAFLSFLSSFFALFSAGRLSAALSLLFAVLALGALVLASAVVTAVVVRAADVVSMYGYRVSVEAKRGGRFLALTWAGSGVGLLGVLWWCGEFVVGRRGKRTGRGVVADEGVAQPASQ